MTEAHLPPDELASRYLDGDLPDELRALVDDDPRLLEVVARLRSAREALRDVDPIDPARGEAALAAAMAAYDAAFETRSARPSTVDHPARVVSLRAARWRRSLTWAGGVAAAGLVVVGGAALVVGDDDRSPVADDQVTTVAGQPVTAEPSPAGVAEALTADTQGTDAPGDDRAVAASEVPLATASGDEPPAEQLDEPFPLPPAGSPVILDDPTTLQWFARWAEPVPVDDLDPADVPCLAVGPDLLLSANAIYAGVPAVVFADESTGEAIAYDADGCAVLARVTP
jgi:hypothetical protein